MLFKKWCKFGLNKKSKTCVASHVAKITPLVIMKNECLWEVDIKFKILCER